MKHQRWGTVFVPESQISHSVAFWNGMSTFCCVKYVIPTGWGRSQRVKTSIIVLNVQSTPTVHRKRASAGRMWKYLSQTFPHSVAIFPKVTFVNAWKELLSFSWHHQFGVTVRIATSPGFCQQLRAGETKQWRGRMSWRRLDLPISGTVDAM